VRRFLVLLGLAILIVSLCGACAPVTEEPTGEDQPPAAEPKVLVFGAGNQPGDINPLIGKNICAEFIDINVYDTLVGRGKKVSPEGYAMEDPDNVIPGLAESWDISADGLTYTFHLREDVRFHNGNPFDADDVVFTFEMLQANGSYATTFDELIAEVKATGQYTVDLTLNRVDPQFLRRIGTYNGCILDKETVLAAGSDVTTQMEWLASHAIGTGPFVLGELTTDIARLEANPDYWAGPAALDEVIIKTIPEAANRKIMLEKGDIDIARSPGTTDYADLEANPDIDLVIRPGNSKVYYFAMNTQYPPFDDVRVRQAIAHAIPYEVLIEAVWGGDKYCPQAHSLITSQFPSHIPVYNYEYDLDKAKALLAEAGYADGFDIQFDLFDVPAYRNCAVMLQAELGKIGINMEIQPMAPPAFFQAGDAGELNLVVNSWWDNSADVVALMRKLAHTASIPSEGNWAQYSNPAVDQLIEKAEVEMDPAVRIAYLEAIQEILAEDVPYAVFGEGQIVFAANKKVQGYVHYTDALFRFYEMDIDTGQ